jgi:hypothetical protein
MQHMCEHISRAHRRCSLKASLDRILTELKNAQESQEVRKPCSFTLPPSVFDAFKTRCEQSGLPMARVLEALIRDSLQQPASPQN